MNNIFYVPTVLLYFVGISVFVAGPQAKSLADNSTFTLTAALLLLAILVVLNVVGLGVGKWVNNLGGIGTAITAVVLIGMGLAVWSRYGTGLTLRVWQEAGSSGYTFTDLGYQSCWETSCKQSGTHGILTNFTGGNLGAMLNQGKLQERAQQFVKEVDRVFPGAAPAYTGQAVRQHWPSVPNVLGSYTCHLAGQYSTIGGVAQVPVGNLFFAGEHTSTESIGFMDGACESGERAATEVLRHFHGQKRRATKSGLSRRNFFPEGRLINIAAANEKRIQTSRLVNNGGI
jgi:flavin-dependent amine oxidoreductase